jgi:hypothetical protein
VQPIGLDIRSRPLPDNDSDCLRVGTKEANNEIVSDAMRTEDPEWVRMSPGQEYA